MFNPFVRKPKAINSLIDRKLLDLVETDPASDNFVTATDQIVKLHKLKSSEDNQRVSPDVLVQAATSIAGVVLIVRAEQFNVISQKALSFVKKP